MTDTLHLLQMRPDARLLAAWVARHHARHEKQASDLGDAFHGLLRAAFGELAPQPFRYLDEQRGLLAYTALDADAVRAQVALAGLTNDLAVQTLGLDATAQHGGYRLRPFPTQWQQGQLLGFEVRVRPTVRAAKGEQDVFLQARQTDAPLSRGEVYAHWLRNHLAGREGAAREPWQGAVELLDVELTAFQRLAIVRRTQAAAGLRRGVAIDGPDAVLSGHLCVRDSAACAQLLQRGVGRHRAFGFGMLLLHRAD